VVEVRTVPADYWNPAEKGAAMARWRFPKEEDWPKILVIIELAKLVTWIILAVSGLLGSPP
jgi:hypothetical protein